jgi:hypothetical protein
LNNLGKWKEGTELAKSLGLAMTALLQHTVAGAVLDFVGPTACTVFGVLFKKKDAKLWIQN